MVPGEPPPRRRAAAAGRRRGRATPPTRLPGRRRATLRLLARPARSAGPAAGPRDELAVRFQQTCGPVMAKGVEDTAFYRWSRLSR